ncbi:hypothetical protein LPJ75_006678, partial [Coemansia sp. RSA 2598]
MSDSSIGPRNDASLPRDDSNTAPFNERTLELQEVGPDTFLSVDLWRPKGNRG